MNSETSPQYGTHWQPERIFKPFFNRKEPHYNEQHDALFCLYDSQLCVVSRSSCAILSSIGSYGDYITAFAVMKDASLVVTSSSSFLFRVYQLDWKNFRQRCAQNIDQFGPEGTYTTSLSPNLDDGPNNTPSSSSLLLHATEIRSWKGPDVAATCLTLSPLSPLVAAAFTDGTIYLYDLHQTYCTHVFRSPASNVGILRFHPTRLLLFSSSDTGDLWIHDLYRHVSCVCLKDHRKLPTCMDFIIPEEGEEEGKQKKKKKNKLSPHKPPLGGIISSGFDKVINLWNLDSLDTLLTERVNNLIQSHSCISKSVCQVSLGLPLHETELQMLNEGSNTSFLNPSGADVSKRKVKGKRTHETSSVVAFLPRKQVEAWYLKWIFPHPVVLSPVHQLSVDESLNALCCIKTALCVNCRVSLQSKATIPLKELATWIIVAAGETGGISLWNPETREKITTLLSSETKEMSPVLTLFRCTSPEGAPWLLCGSMDFQIVFWNLRNFSIEKSLLGAGSELIFCQFINVPASHYLTYEKDQVNNEEEEENMKLAPSIPFKRALLLRSDHSCVVFEMSLNRANTLLLRGHTDTVLDASSTQDGCWIVTGSKDHTVRVWSTRLEKCVATLNCHTAPVVAVKTSHNRKYTTKHPCSCLPLSASSCGEVGKEEQQGHSCPPCGTMDFFILSVCLDGILKLSHMKVQDLCGSLQVSCETTSCQVLFDMTKADIPFQSYQKSGTLLLKLTSSKHSVQSHDREVNVLDLSFNDKMAATGSSDKTIKVWSLPDLTLLGVCVGHTRSVVALQFSRVEKVLASGSADQTIRLWNLQDFSCLKMLQGHRSSVLSVKFLSLGTQLVSSSNDGQIKLWNIRTSECCQSFDAHDGEKIWSISVDSAEQYLLSASSNCTLILWKNTWEEFQASQAEKARAKALDVTEIESLRRSGKLLDALSLSLKTRRMFQTQQILEETHQKLLFETMDQDYQVHCMKPTGAAQLVAQHVTDKISSSVITGEQLSEWITSLPEPQLKTLVEFIVQWNTNGRTSYLANNLLQYVLRHVPVNKLLRIEGLHSLISGFSSYTPRHLNRLNALLERTFILDMIFLTSAGKSFLDVPQLPDRSSNDASPTRTLDPLSIHDTYRMIFE